MDQPVSRLAVLLLGLAVTGCLTGAGACEQAVLDSAWPHKPSIVRPAEGGANRKRFWVPANIAGVLALLLAGWAAWPVTAARYATLTGIALFIVINAVTIAYFAPAVLRVERHSATADDPASLRWVRLSRWRTLLSLGVNASLAFAALLLAGA